MTGIRFSRGVKKILAAACLVVLLAAPASARGRQHWGVQGYTLTNSLDGAEQQKVVVLVNRHDLSFNSEALFNYDTDEGPCDGARVYVDYLKLWYRAQPGDAWVIEGTPINPDAWYGTGGNACPDADRFVSTDWGGHRCGYFYAEARFKVDWGQPNGNITPPLVRTSNVVHPCG